MILINMADLDRTPSKLLVAKKADLSLCPVFLFKIKNVIIQFDESVALSTLHTQYLLYTTRYTGKLHEC